MVGIRENDMVSVIELHESSKLELGLAIANRKEKMESITATSNHAPVFFSGSFEFFGTDFEVSGRGSDDRAWLAASIYGSEIVQNQCKSIKIRPVAMPTGEGMVVYICGILIDTCTAISSFYKDKPVMFRTKGVAGKDCIGLVGYPPEFKLVVKRMESNPLLLKEVLEAAIVDVALSRVDAHG